MERWIDVLSLVLKLFTLYTAVTGLFFLLPQKSYRRCDPKTRFAVLIPARNEEAVIGHTVAQFLKQTYPESLYDLYIIPNNCTDGTAEAARRAGAKVMVCTVPVRTKGQVLKWAFQQLEPMAYDAYCIFDADNLVDPNFLARMNDAFCAGARLAKGLQKASNPDETWITGCYDLYVENFNLLYSRPRGRLGLSAKLIGTGFAVSRSLLNEAGGFTTVTLTEDTEFAVQCALLGEKVWWVPEAVTYDEEPLSFRVSMVQRRRWSSGVMQTFQVYLPRLLKAIFTGGRPLLCFDITMLIAGPAMQVLGLIPRRVRPLADHRRRQLAGPGDQCSLLLGGHDGHRPVLGRGGQAPSVQNVEDDFALSPVHRLLVSPAHPVGVQKGSGVEAHCPSGLQAHAQLSVR